MVTYFLSTNINVSKIQCLVYFCIQPGKSKTRLRDKNRAERQFSVSEVQLDSDLHTAELKVSTSYTFILLSLKEIYFS